MPAPAAGSFSPRTPHEGKPAARGQAGRTGGRPIGFFDHARWTVRQKPVDCPPCNSVTPRHSKENHPASLSKNPRVVPILPRVVSFFPRVGFVDGSPVPFSFSLFSLEKEREREGLGGKGAIHGFLGLLKKASTGLITHPRVFGGCFFGQKSIRTRVYRVHGAHPRVHGSKCLYAWPKVRNER